MKSFPATKEKRRIAEFAVLLVVTAAAFSPILNNGFTGWDDAVYVTENPLITTLSGVGVARIFSTFVSGNYHPLAVLLHAVEYRFFDVDPRPYHGISLVLHLGNTALVFRLLQQLIRRGSTAPNSDAVECRQQGTAGALFGTLLFALHPMRVENVAWISDQKDLLSSSFALGALIVHAGSNGVDGARRKAALFLLCVLAMLSKATAVVLPLMLLLIEHLRHTLDLRAMLWKIPIFCASAVFGIVALAARASYQPVLQEIPLGVGSTLSMSLYRFLCYYLARTVAPFTNALPLYPSPESMTSGGIISRNAILVVVFAVLSGLVVLSLRRTRVVFFGSLFFLITLLPSLPVAALGFSADRFSYLPSLGLCFVAGVGFQWAWSFRWETRRFARVILVVMAGCVCMALAFASFRQSQVWRTSVTLWTYALRIYPETSGHEYNRSHAYHNRGRAWQKEGAMDRALEDFNSAVTLMPDRAEFLTSRGMAHGARREVALALEDFTRAIETGSGGVVPLIERGILSTQAGNTVAAAADFNRAILIEPENVAARFNLGVVLLDSGQPEAARQEFTRLLNQEAGNAAAYYGRAMAETALGDFRRAFADLARAAALGYPVAPAFLEKVRLQAERQR